MKNTSKITIFSLIIFATFITPTTFAKSGDQFECSNYRFTISGILNSTDMELSVLDKKGLVTFDKKEARTYKFEESDNYRNEFKSGLTFDAWATEHTLVLNMPAKAFRYNIKKPFKAEFITYFEGFNPTAWVGLTCHKID